MPNFKPFNYNQNAMVVINFEQQIQPNTFEFALHHLISHRLDLSIFNSAFKNDHNGRPAYDPVIMLKIILFAYSKGITSSREIQWNCETNIIFKALSCDTVPHFTSIASFVSSHPKQIQSIFEQVLLVCDQEGLLGKELVAIDGCKMSSNASKEWSGTLKELTEKHQKIRRQIQYHMTAHQQADLHQKSEQEAAEKRSEQAIKTLTKAADKIERFLADAEPRMGQGKRKSEVKSNITDNESGKMTTSKGTIQGFNGVAAVDKKHQIVVDAQAFGEGQEHHTLKPILESIDAKFKRLSISDSIYQTGMVVTADTGFANEANMKYLHSEGINGYIPDNKFRSRDPKFAEQKAKYGKRNQHIKTTKLAHLIPASEFSFDPVNQTCICPAGNQISHRGERPDQYGNIKVFFEGRLSQCKHCELKHKCMKTPESANHRKGNGRQVSFKLDHKRAPNFTDWMKHRVDSAKGKQIYSHRMSVVEPVFGNIGTNKGLNKFSLRGKEKVTAQWQLFCLVHNIEKIGNYGNLAA